jgi:hypothetical protein
MYSIWERGLNCLVHQAGGCVPGLEVVGSRFVLQGHRILDSRDEARVVEELRLICHHTKYNVTVFHPYFIYFDQVSKPSVINKNKPLKSIWL